MNAPPETPPTARMILRGIEGGVIAEGTFELLYRELGEDGTINLVLGDRTRRLTVCIPCVLLDDVGPSPDPEEVHRRAQEAQNATIDRWVL